MSPDVGLIEISESARFVGERVRSGDIRALREISNDYQQQYRESGESDHRSELMGFLSGWFASEIERMVGVGENRREIDLGLDMAENLPRIVMQMPEYATVKGETVHFRERLLGEVYDGVIQPALDHRHRPFEYREKLRAQWQGVMAEILGHRILEGEGWERITSREVDKKGGDVIGLKEDEDPMKAIVFQIKSDTDLIIEPLDMAGEFRGKMVRPEQMVEASIKVVGKHLAANGYTEVRYSGRDGVYYMRDSQGRKRICTLDAGYLGIPIEKATKAGATESWHFSLRNGEMVGVPGNIEIPPGASLEERKKIIKEGRWFAVLDSFADQVNNKFNE